MKYGIYFLMTIGLVFAAYQTAQNQISRPLNLSSISLGMTVPEINKHFGTPSALIRNHYTYILSDGSELNFTLRDGLVSSANVKFHRKIQIQDPEMRKLSLVQMEDH